MSIAERTMLEEIAQVNAEIAEAEAAGDKKTCKALRSLKAKLFRAHREHCKTVEASREGLKKAASMAEAPKEPLRGLEPEAEEQPAPTPKRNRKGKAP
jgi:hypothetical protein